MGRRKPAAESTISFNVTLPRKLARRLDAELAKMKKLVPYMVISRSALVSHALGEWCSLLDNPALQPTLPVRARARPPAVRAGPVNVRSCPRLTPAEIRKIRRDKRPAVEIARAFGVDKSTIGRVRNGDTWRQIL